jgi:UDP-glucose 4-epimerase
LPNSLCQIGPRFLGRVTAAVYGEPGIGLLDETMPCLPINPDGASKMMAERILTDIAAASGTRFAILL